MSPEQGVFEKSYLRPSKAMRLKCLDCSGYQTIEVKLCPVTDCPLYPYRMGKRPSKGFVLEKFTAVRKKLIQKDNMAEADKKAYDNLAEGYI